MRNDLDVLLHELAIAVKPAVLNRQPCRLVIRLASPPSNEPLLKSFHRPDVALLAIHGNLGPHPRDAAMVRVIGVEVVGQDGAVRRVDRVQVRRSPHRLGEPWGQYHAVIVDEDWFAILRQFKPRAYRLHGRQRATARRPSA